MKLMKLSKITTKVRDEMPTNKFIISIDDGYVEWQYLLETQGSHSINDFITSIQNNFSAVIIDSKIRTMYRRSGDVRQ